MLGKIKQYIPNIFKTVYFNFKFLPFGEAIYLPILVDRRTAIIKKSTGKITIEDKSAYHKIYIGFPCLKDRYLYQWASMLSGTGVCGQWCETSN